jgi:aldose 1-epimerase
MPVPPELDFRSPRAVNGAVLDTLYTANRPTSGEDMTCVARLGHRTATGRVSVFCPLAFRQLLLFTPPHRKAVAIEPYTCATDAPNLAARGIDSGWRVLPPGGRWSAAVEYRWEPGAR